MSNPSTHSMSFTQAIDRAVDAFNAVTGATSMLMLVKGKNAATIINTPHQQGGQQAAVGAAALTSIVAAINMPNDEARFALLFDQLSPQRQASLTTFLKSKQMDDFKASFRYILVLAEALYNQLHPQTPPNPPMGERLVIRLLETIADLPTVDQQFERAQTMGLLEPVQANASIVGYLKTVGEYIRDHQQGWYIELEAQLGPINQTIKSACAVVEAHNKRRLNKILS